MADQPFLPTIPSLQPYSVGVGELARIEHGVRLLLPGASDAQYSDAQLDDFHMDAGRRERDEFVWRPPLRLELRARFSHSQQALRGTAGFGWWNAPFAGDRATVVGVGPQVLWFFFGSPPNNLAATPGWSGHGWFAQGLNVPTLPGWLVEAGMWAMRLPGVRWLARRGAGSVSRAAEQPLHDVDITQWHDYALEWRGDEAAWWVDGTCVLRYRQPPRGPLALVLWVDNQWADLENHSGLLATPDPQWLDIAEVELHNL